MRSVSEVFILFLVFVVSANSDLPDCHKRKGSVFINEPSNIEVTCGSNGVAVFPCKYNIKTSNKSTQFFLRWIINNSTHNSSNLPQNHIYNGSALTVKNVQLRQNNTIYQCQLVSTTCAHRSTTGTLILRKCPVPSVKCSSWYDYKGPQAYILKMISTNITKTADYTDYYNITYKNQHSGKLCATQRVQASSYVGGICHRTLNISSDKLNCFGGSNIIVTVIAIYTNDTLFAQAELVNTYIDANNGFVKVSFDTSTPSIGLKFINQPKLNKKFYEVRYGPVTSGCTHHMEGYLFNSNFISLEISIDFKKTTKICFFVMVNNGTKTVNVEGVYEADTITALSASDSATKISPHVQDAIKGATVAVVLLGVTVLGFGIFLYVYVNKKPKSGDLEKTNNAESQSVEPCKMESKIIEDSGTAKSSRKDSKVDRDNDIAKSWKQESRKAYEKSVTIDKSTTFYGLHYVTSAEDCLMDEFAKTFYPDYDPSDGFGYYELLLSTSSKEFGEIESSSDVIVLNKDNQPERNISVSDIGNDYERGSVYVQSKSVKTKLKKGSKFLYCARSKVITAYTKEITVDQKCKEVTLMKEKVVGYKKEWIRYGYFEFTGIEVVKPNQRIIVQKKNGDLVTGPGVRHIVVKGSGSDPVSPPQLSQRDWKHVFIQSKDGERELNPGTKYLFCAAMDRVRETVHYDVYDVDKSWNMAKFAKSKIPGFKPELGYGYYEFKQPEYIEPEKKVVLVDKDKRLYTGVGARFFYIGVLTSDHIRKKEQEPPDLNGTRWEHIFIQSHSYKRVLSPGSKFLYFEYQTHK